jgi:hypothetical protein
MRSIEKNLYATEGLKYLPQILTMLDQNPLSPTYGCGDRQFWLYKSTDFPCGMYGEFALPLALAFSKDFPNNPYHNQERIKQLAVAVIHNQILTSHKDGSNDDFYPNEKAMGSTGFTLFAMAETIRLLNITDDDILEFLHRRATWLATGDESGRLTNHHALNALGVFMISQTTNDSKLLKSATEIRDRVLSWQTDEGWFPEYGGFDAGYHSFTIGFLAYLRHLSGDDTFTKPLLNAIDLSAELVAPDGTYGGEFGSRNSYHFLPHGFELMAPEYGPARYVADKFLTALKNGTRSYLDENRTFCHYQYNFLMSWIDFADRENCSNWAPKNGIKKFPTAGIISVRNDTTHSIISTKKGGTLKASTSLAPVASDTGPVIADSANKSYWATSPSSSAPNIIENSDGSISIALDLEFTKIPNTVQATTFRILILRLLNLTVGRLNPNLLRSFIQHLLINRKKVIGITGKRQIRISENEISIVNELNQSSPIIKLSKIYLSSDLTAIYTASSNPWHISRLFPWIDCSEFVEKFNKTGTIKISRNWPVKSK